LGSYEGGREKAPAALCRKIAMAKDGDEIEVWGDGNQTRSFMYIDDCVEGVYRIAQSDYHKPLNLGSDRLVTVNQLIDIIAEIAGKTIRKRYDLSKPQGVRGRNSDNTLILQVLNWQPSIPLEAGLEKTYRWIEGELSKRGRL
jgi:nucleoside-diphosphate-sugar epimerase